MAKEGDDYQFWTLPEFLVHGDDGGENLPELFHGTQKDGSGGFGDCFSPEMTPELYHRLKRTSAGRYGAPFADEDCFAELTREFAHSSSSSSSSIRRSSSFKFEDEKVWGSFGSPELALSSPAGGGACGCNRCFSCSAPRRAMRSDAALELLHAAVEEIARLRMVEEAALFRSMEKKAAAAVSVPPRIHRQNPLQQPFQQEMNAFQFQMLRQQLEVTQKKSHYRQTHRGAVHGGGRRQSASPASSSGGRPVFHGIPAPKKRECAGTGVFLPRGVVSSSSSSSSSAPPRKKHGSSTVSDGRKAPAAAQPKNGRWSKATDRDEVVPPRFRSGSGGGGVVEERKRISRQLSVAVDELQLPQEWTY